MGQASGDAGGPGRRAEPAEGPAGCAGMRADARRNRVQILAAAEAVFAEEGLAVPIDEVARRAGVGVGTLYRHFPTKESLFEAVVVNHMERLTQDVLALLERDDPGPALFEFLGHVAHEGSSKRNLVDALSGAGINIKETAPNCKQQLEEAAGQLLERAQKAGQVRADVSLADVIGLVLSACNADIPESSQARMVAIVCDGLRVESPADARPARAGSRS